MTSLSQVRISSGPAHRSVVDHTFHFENGSVLTFTIDGEAGDSIAIGEAIAKVFLSEKENYVTKDVMPAETNLINLAHVIMRQERPRLAVEPSEEQKMALFETYKEAGGIH